MFPGVSLTRSSWSRKTKLQCFPGWLTRSSRPRRTKLQCVPGWVWRDPPGAAGLNQCFPGWVWRDPPGPAGLNFNVSWGEFDKVLQALGRVVHVVQEDLGGLGRGPPHLGQRGQIKPLIKDHTTKYHKNARKIKNKSAKVRLIITMSQGYTAKTKHRNFETNIPRKGISGSQSQFPHSCVCERFIYSHHRSAYAAGGNM